MLDRPHGRRRRASTTTPTEQGHTQQQRQPPSGGTCDSPAPSALRAPCRRTPSFLGLLLLLALVAATVAEASSSHRPLLAAVNMLKNDASGPAKPPKVAAAAAAAVKGELAAARTTATSPSSNATSLRFGDRLMQQAAMAQQQQQQRSPAREKAAAAGGEASHAHAHHHHHVHEEALPLETAGGSIGIGGGIERPRAVLLAEGPGFRFESISQCELPTDRGLFHLRAYRYTTTVPVKTATGMGGPSRQGVVVEPVVLFQGSHAGKRSVLVRVHDQCLTSEVLGSRRCDCKEQLELAMDRIAAGDEGGLIIYLPQEGRGIGLANKVAAYALQEQGLDTVDANLFLGFGDDERTYDYVPYILKDFGIESIRLATNNPFKTRSLRAAGVAVSGVEPLQAPFTAHNHHYLRTKVLKMEHAIELPPPGHVHTHATALSASPSSGSVGSLTERGGTTSSEEALTEASESEEMGMALLLEEEEERDDNEEEEEEDEQRQATPTARPRPETELAEGELQARGGEGKQRPPEVEAEEAPRYAFGRETVEAAIQAIAEGKMVVVVDDEDRENEGDIIMAADAVTTEAMAFIVRHCSGVVCVSLEGEELERLKLPPMIVDNEDPKCTAFTVSVDYKYGTTTGISAHDRALTLRALASAEATATDFTRPGHIFPLRYTPGGVMRRRGHTEAALDLSRLAGRRPAGVLCEVCSEDGSMARLPELKEFCRKHGGLVLTSIADLVAYRHETETEGRR